MLHLSLPSFIDLSSQSCSSQTSKLHHPHFLSLSIDSAHWGVHQSHQYSSQRYPCPQAKWPSKRGHMTKGKDDVSLLYATRYNSAQCIDTWGRHPIFLSPPCEQVFEHAHDSPRFPTRDVVLDIRDCELENLWECFAKSNKRQGYNQEEYDN